MKQKWLVLMGVGLLLAATGPAQADDDTKAIAQRIQALRDRLQQFRQGKGDAAAKKAGSQAANAIRSEGGAEAAGAKPAPAVAAPSVAPVSIEAAASSGPGGSLADLAVESEALEHRQDVKVLILFHEGENGPSSATDSTSSPSGASVGPNGSGNGAGVEGAPGPSKASDRAPAPAAAPAGMQRPALAPARDGFPSPASLKKSWLEEARRRLAQRQADPTL
ncbi:MAG: hypothetical protein OZSIB_0027 [Candidatus Ozemobacter sibiricus]|jgi:hypothetical protein|uniref:Uncharacterized protein n=1 Tax=Candidatus Ozemobacter sibiricus TaxID=2268124 RepID=A0A367ZNE4_9BACT|nr:MAG: hypothetical protein OZSIB_0027 [Candidatus Ozemobacter sibiricus]